MADSKISALPASTVPLTGTEIVPIVQSSTTKQVSVANIVGAGTSPGKFTALFATSSEATLNLNSTGNQPWQCISGGGVAAPVGNFVIRSGSTGATPISIDVAAPSNALYVSSTGVTFNAGNLIQGTAAKGINFTANTPAAGMTSQLLNWYEEGTWTPAVTSYSGTITTYTAVGKFTRIGRSVNLSFSISITNNGTGAGGIKVNSLPYALASTNLDAGSAKEILGSGNACSISSISTTSLGITTYNNGYPGGTNYQIIGSITYTT